MADYDIRSIFEEMELELIRSMKRNLSRHMQWEKDEEMNWTMWQAEQLKTLEQFKRENEKIFGKKFSIINKEIEEFLKDTYEISGLEQEKAILNAIKDNKKFKDKYTKGLEGSFFQLNEDKMNALIKATTDDLPKAEHAMLRMVNDQYRKTIFKAEVMANSGAFTLQQSIDMATNDFLKAGINCIEYKNGRRVNIASYAEMCIRTATKRAALTAEGDVRNAYGIHTVRISKYGGCSETCLPWQGRVYVDDVWSGGTKEEAKEKNIPLLSEAMNGGLFHPNCKHRAATYFYDLKKEQGKLKDDGIENPTEEQEHRKNHLHIQQQKRIEQGSLDSKNIEQAKARKEEWIEKDKNLGFDDEFWAMYKKSRENKKQVVEIPKKVIPEKFIEANSIKEATEYMKVYSKYDKFDVDDSFKVSILNGFNESAYNVKKRYGKDLDIKGIERMPEARRDQAAYSPTSKKISLKNSSLTTLKKNAVKNYESDWNATDDVYGVFYHEIGHAVWEDLPGSAKLEVMTLYRDTMKSSYDEWIQLGGKSSMFRQDEVFGMKLSRYGSKNEKEFFSEAFSQIMSGVDTEISEKVDDILMRKYADKAHIVKLNINNDLKNTSEKIIKLAEQEEYALKQYISSESYKLNDKLRRGVELTDIDKQLVTDLNSALDKMPAYEGMVTRDLTFMYEDDINDFIETHKVGDIVSYEAFTSSTKNKIYSDGPDVRLIIKSKSGRDISKYNGKEAEVLFKTKCSFKILKQEEKDGIIILHMSEE